jgi:hypothetical protein
MNKIKSKLNALLGFIRIAKQGISEIYWIRKTAWHMEALL